MGFFNAKMLKSAKILSPGLWKLAEVEINTLSNIFSKAEAVTLVEILSGWLVKVDIVKITKRLF